MAHFERFPVDQNPYRNKAKQKKAKRDLNPRRQAFVAYALSLCR
jgi:hypothetical protein